MNKYYNKVFIMVLFLTIVVPTFYSLYFVATKYKTRLCPSKSINYDVFDVKYYDYVSFDNGGGVALYNTTFCYKNNTCIAIRGLIFDDYNASLKNISVLYKNCNYHQLPYTVKDVPQLNNKIKYLILSKHQMYDDNSFFDKPTILMSLAIILIIATVLVTAAFAYNFDITTCRCHVN